MCVSRRTANSHCRQPCSWQQTISARPSRPNRASSCLCRISLRRPCRPTWYAEAGGAPWRTGTRREMAMAACGSQGVSYADAASRSLGGSWPGRLRREYMRPRSWLLSWPTPSVLVLLSSDNLQTILLFFDTRTPRAYIHSLGVPCPSHVPARLSPHPHFPFTLLPAARTSPTLCVLARPLHTCRP